MFVRQGFAAENLIFTHRKSRVEIIEDFQMRFSFSHFSLLTTAVKTSFNELNLRFFLCFFSSTLQLPSCFIRTTLLLLVNKKLRSFHKTFCGFSMPNKPATREHPMILFLCSCTVEKKKVDYRIKFKI